MALDATKVRTGIAGEWLVGPTTATPPVSAAAATTGYVGLGYISSDGIVPKPERSTKDIKAWQNNAVVRTLTTDAKVVYAFTLIETNAATIGFAFGTTVTQSATEGTYNADPNASGGTKKHICDVIDGTNLHRETFDGELTKMTPSGFVNGEATSYACEVTAYTVPIVRDTALKTP